jgi:hypothetical protein
MLVGACVLAACASAAEPNRSITLPPPLASVPDTVDSQESLPDFVGSIEPQIVELADGFELVLDVPERIGDEFTRASLEQTNIDARRLRNQIDRWLDGSDALPCLADARDALTGLAESVGALGDYALALSNAPDVDQLKVDGAAALRRLRESLAVARDASASAACDGVPSPSTSIGQTPLEAFTFFVARLERGLVDFADEFEFLLGMPENIGNAFTLQALEQATLEGMSIADSIHRWLDTHDEVPCLVDARGALSSVADSVTSVGRAALAISTDPDDADAQAEGAAALERLRADKAALEESTDAVVCG